MRFVLMLFCLCGCSGGVRGITGGTAGELRTGDSPLGDIQVTVHQVEDGSTEPVGFAIARSDGSFERVTPGAEGPLRLTPGEYCCTLESAGAPVLISKEFSNPKTTPLKIEWSAGDQSLDLDFQPAKGNHR